MSREARPQHAIDTNESPRHLTGKTTAKENKKISKTVRCRKRAGVIRQSQCYLLAKGETSWQSHSLRARSRHNITLMLTREEKQLTFNRCRKICDQRVKRKLSRRIIPAIMRCTFLSKATGGDDAGRSFGGQRPELEGATEGLPEVSN